MLTECFKCKEDIERNKTRIEAQKQISNAEREAEDGAIWRRIQEAKRQNQNQDQNNN